MAICSHCGFAANPEGARFCARCASPLDGEGLPSDSMTERGKTLAANTVLSGHYTVLEKFSEGGMGAVYLAQDTRLFNRLCIVKEMLPFYTTDEERRLAERNFEREARTLAALRSPGIPQIYDYFIEENRYYLVMEFVEGEDLGKALAKSGSSIAEKELVSYGLQLARILAYLAELDPPIIHRDIKPANIILEKSTGQVKLVDFGIARSSIRSERLDATRSMIMGTRGYSPPEQYAGDAVLASDIYALGATLHHLVTGQHPSRSPAPFKFASIRELRAELSTGLDILLQEMLRPDPGQRPTAAQVKERFERLSGTQVAQTAFVMRNGAEVYSVGELVRACEQSPDAGRYHLIQGHLRDWLMGQNRHDLAEWAARCVTEAPDERIALEWFLRGCDPNLSPPAMNVADDVLDFGEVERDSSYSLLVPYTNTTRGYLVVAAASQVPWLRVETEYSGCYAGENGQVQVTLDTRNMPPGSYSQEALVLAWEDHQRRLSARLAVTWPPGGQLEPPLLELGDLLEGQPAPACELRLRSTGGSDWVGRVYSNTPWLAVAGSAFRVPSQTEMRVPLAIYPGRMPFGMPQRGTVAVVSNAGSQVSVVTARTARQWYTGSSRIRRWVAFVVPTLLSWLGLGFGMANLAQALLGIAAPPLTAFYSAAVGLAAWVLGLMLAATFVPALDEIENFRHRGDLSLDLPVHEFRIGRASLLLAIGALAGAAIGLAYSRSNTPAAGNALFGLLGLILGLLAALVITAGSSDAARGTSPMPGVAWLARRPTLMALIRGGLGSFCLALLATMLAVIWQAPRLGSAIIGAWAGLLAASDGYPYWPLRGHAQLAWLRPALRAIVAGYGIYLLGIQIVARGMIPWSAWWRLGLGGAIPVVAATAGLLAFVLGGIVGLAAHDEVGYHWRKEAQKIAPLALLLLLVASALFWILYALLAPLTGTNPAGWTALLLAALTTAALALGLTGRSAMVRRWLERSQAKAAGMLRQYQIPDGAQGLMTRGQGSFKWLAGVTQQTAHHPVTLAVVVSVAVQTAPVLVRLSGTLLLILLLVAASTAAILWWRRREIRPEAVKGARQ